MSNLLLLNGFCYSDWATSVSNRRSISGYLYCFGNAPISWKSKQQTILALSTSKAELIACTEASREAMWLKYLSKELIAATEIKIFANSNPSVKLFCDNQSALSICNGLTNPTGRNKHIDMRYHHARDMQERKFITFQYVPSEQNLADILTKGLSAKRHQEMCVAMDLYADKDINDIGNLAV